MELGQASLFPIIRDHPAALGALDVFQQGRQNIGVIPIAFRPLRVIDLCVLFHKVVDGFLGQIPGFWTRWVFLCGRCGTHRFFGSSSVSHGIHTAKSAMAPARPSRCP